ncbi:MAG TPA: Hpt domain-containing protein [Polyangiaceae bacterium]|nr:Hpt domain-containing protein [Polyangiaceae bacterium]
MQRDPQGASEHSTKIKSLRNKFIQTLLLVAGIIGLSTLGIVGVMSAQASAEHLRSTQEYIEEGIASKGTVLTQNHALALRGLTLDNAFLDMQRLLERAIKDDRDLVYGVYVSSEHETLALARRPLSATEATPERDAWKKLGLGDQEVIVKAPRVERRNRLGQELLEVAAPVVGEDGEVLGTVRYGLSTKRMQDALRAAKAESSARLNRSFVLIGLLVGLSVIVGVVLSRFQAVRITRPIGDLTRAAELLAGGDHGVQVDIRSHDELEVLGASFNRMARDLGASYRNLEEMNRTLEQKVAARTTQLADKNRDMRLVLDNVDQGFVTLSPDGVMALERSRKLGEWFGDTHGQLPFWQYLAPTNETFAATFELGWSQIADDFLPLDVCLAQLPERLTQGTRTWSLRYQPFFRDAKLEGVLVAIADVTERLARERDDAEHTELMQAFRRLVQDRVGFEVFLAESSELVASLCSGKFDHDSVLLNRALHTLKGTCGSMGLSMVAQYCHSLESQLAEDGEPSPELLATLGARWQALLDQLTSSGLRHQRMVEIPEKEYAEFFHMVGDGSLPRRELLLRLAAWQAEPVERAFQRLGDQAIGVARRFGKPDLRVVVDAGGLRLDRARFGAFFGELVHVMRNALDHGIEKPEERLRAGKPAAGTLALRAATTNGQLAIEVSDDGAGIDWEGIRRVATTRGLPHRTQADLLDALCKDGVTTRSEVTTLSGRGVGMAAFRECVSSLHGTLEVRSVRGRGTTWIARFPLAETEAQAWQTGIFPARAARSLIPVEQAERH